MNDFSYKLKDYVCINPFNRLEIYNSDVFCCCASWNNTPIGNTNNLKDILDSDVLRKIRHSVLDGSYSYCDKSKCPFLLHLIHDNNIGQVFRKKSEINIDELFEINQKLELKINIDDSCTLSCPSCRLSLVMADGKQVQDIQMKMDEITNLFGKYTHSIHISGSADPFASEVFRNFLTNFKDEDYPNLKIINIYTNANLLDEKMWNRISKVHKYIHQIEISIDAATEETYKIVRRNGNWKKLFNNIKFIHTISTITNINYSFVVQDTNYKEMEEFSNLITNLQHKISYGIFFNRILNWGTFSDEEFKKKKIWDEAHPDFDDFLIELNKAVKKYSTYFDMSDIIDKYSLKGIKKLI